MREIIYTGPQNEVLIRLHKPAPQFNAIFRRWGKPVPVPECHVELILKMPGFIEKNFSMTQWLDRYPDSVVEIARYSALGDVLQLILALRDKSYLSNRIRIRTQESYKELATHFWFGNVADPSKVTLRLNFDGLVEQDATSALFSGMHRVDIYRQALEFDLNKKPIMMNEDLSAYWGDPRIKIPYGKYWVINRSGSRKDNSLDPLIIDEVVSKLRDKIQLVQIRDITKGDTDHPLDFHCGQDYPDLFYLVKNSQGVLVTDSGLMWVSHFTNTPIHVMLKSSPSSTRMNYAPDGSTHINLNKLEPFIPSPYAWSGDSDLLVKALLNNLNISEG